MKDRREYYRQWRKRNPGYMSEWRAKLMSKPPESRGMSMQDAIELRKQEVSVHICWKCFNEGVPTPYWLADDLKIPLNDYRSLCPKHYAEKIGGYSG